MPKRRSPPPDTAAVDAYLAAHAPAVRQRLTAIRRLARRIAPDGQERISYRMPAWFCDGVLVYYGAFQRHIGLFPPVADPALKPKLEPYLGPKGNLQLPHDQPLPLDLIEQVLRARLQANRGSAPAAADAKAIAPAKPGAARPAVRRLAGGNPQIAKGDGDAPVQAYIGALDGWKQRVVRRVDALVAREVPDLQRAVKWNSPFYGRSGQGWFLAVHVFTRAVKVTFFKGTSITQGPTGGTSKEGRWIDLTGEAFDEAQLVDWIRQAAALPGWLA